MVRRLRQGLPLLPFLAVVVIFLIIPTVTVIVSSVYTDGVFSFDRIQALFSGTALSALAKSVLLSGSTAIIGAVLGAVLAWLIVSSPPSSMVRRAVISLCSVLAQFGGVALAFAFLATVGLNGVLTLWVQQVFGWNLAGSGWLYSLTGLILVYTYFQIPLMVIVFVPALEGLRDQWREAAVSLGASTWRYWREVAVPLLTPAFLGSALLLFANAFAAYATAAALVSQGSPILPLLIRSALTSEVVLGQSGFAYALALEMIVVVAVVMVAYNALVQPDREVAAVKRNHAGRQGLSRGAVGGLRAVLPVPAVRDGRLLHPQPDRGRPHPAGVEEPRRRRSVVSVDRDLAAAGGFHGGGDAADSGADDDLGAAARAVGQGHGGVPVPASP